MKLALLCFSAFFVVACDPNTGNSGNPAADNGNGRQNLRDEQGNGGATSPQGSTNPPKNIKPGSTNNPDNQPPAEPKKVSDFDRQLARDSIARSELNYGKKEDIKGMITAAEEVLKNIKAAKTKNELDATVTAFMQNLGTSGGVETAAERQSMQRAKQYLSLQDPDKKLIEDTIDKLYQLASNPEYKIASGRVGDLKTAKDTIIRYQSKLIHEFAENITAFTTNDKTDEADKQKLQAEIQKVLKDVKDPMIALYADFVQGWITFNKRGLTGIEEKEAILK